jgi:hypothetical protein
MDPSKPGGGHPLPILQANRDELQRQSACSYAVAVKISTSYPTKYEMLVLQHGLQSYNYALIINTHPEVFIASSLGSFESADGEYLPSLKLLLSENEQTYDIPAQSLSIREDLQREQITIDGFTYPQDQQFQGPTLDYREWALAAVLLYYHSIKAFLGPRAKLRPETAILDKFTTWQSKHKPNASDWKAQTLVRLTEFAHLNDDTKMVRCGIKIFPLRNIHNQTTLPIITPWNEVYCLQLMNQMRRRFICPFFPQYYGNVRIPNTNVHLFQNQGVIDKFAANLEALDKIKRLRERLALEQDEVTLEVLDTMKTHLEAISVLSGECLGVYMEHVTGWSLWLRRFSLVERSGPLEYQTIFFCIMYALYNLGLNRILHTDLHLGNVLIESVAYWQQTIVAHRFKLPMPSKELRGSLESRTGGSEGIEPKLYSPRLMLSAQVLIGKPDLEPQLAAETDSGTFTVGVPIIGTGARIIDFSRACILNPAAFKGIQPYRAEMLEMRNKQLYAMYELLVKELSLMDVSSQTTHIVPELEFMGAAEDQLEAVFRTLEGGDFLLFMGRVMTIFGDMEADKPFAEANRVHIKQLRELASGIYADLAGLMRAKIALFNDARYALVAEYESLYPALIHKHCGLLHDGTSEASNDLLDRIFHLEKRPDGTLYNPQSPNHTRSIPLLEEHYKKSNKDPAPFLKPRWCLSYSCVGAHPDVPAMKHEGGDFVPLGIDKEAS